MTRHSRHAARTCRGCGAGLDASTNVTDDCQPKDGDLSICFYCGEYAVFSDAGFRPLTQEEELEVAGDPRVQSILREMLRFKGKRA